MQRTRNVLVIGMAMVFLGVFCAWVVNNNSVHARVARASDRAYSDLVQKNYPAAVTELREVSRLRPQDRDTQLTLGVTLARAGQKDSALVILRRLAQQDDKAGVSAKKVLARMEKDPHWGRGEGDKQ